MLTIALLAAVAGQPAYRPAENNRPVPACIAQQLTPAVDRSADKARKATPMGELPKAAVERTVSRRIEGCPVPVIISNDAEQNVRSGRR